MKTCTIHQPHFFPWLGYFNKLANSDILVVLDDVQYRSRYYQNRTIIDNVNGPYWFTIPVHHSRHSLISDVRIVEDSNWSMKLVKHLKYNYSNADHFEEVHSDVCNWISKSNSPYLSDLTMGTISLVCEKLGIELGILRSSDLGVRGSPNEKLARICARTQSDAIIFGEGNGLQYHGEVVFKHTGVTVVRQEFLEDLLKFHRKHEIPEVNYSILHYLYHLGYDATREVIQNLWKYR